MANSSITEAMGRHVAQGRRDRPLRSVESSGRKYPLVSVDDHVCEPPTLFEDRMPRKYADRAPRVERRDGVDYWIYEDESFPLSPLDGMVSWDPSDWHLADANYDEFRPGVYDVHHRIKDMDIAGIYGSQCFPSMIIGFAGRRFVEMKEPQFGLAAMRAYNDWLIEEWAGPYPDRIIPSQVTWLADPKLAAEEIEKNAGRGFKAVSFAENPERLGFPSIHKEHWDPFFRACEETETVINLHVGSSSETMVPSSDSPLQTVGALFPVNGVVTCADWLFSMVPIKHPKLKIVLTEGGIGWVPLLLDRLEHMEMEYLPQGLGHNRTSIDITPREILRRNFWFTSYYDPSALQHRHSIGVDRIMMESDYPHGDSTWPKTQDLLDRLLGDCDKEEQDQLTFRNACELYRQPLPPEQYVAEEPN